PEEALADPAFLADGCVAIVDDPEVGRIREVGSTLRLSAGAGPAPGPAPGIGEHTREILDEARAATPATVANTSRGALASPLEGIRVLDLGLAVAGPFGTQVLSDLGADVIKINTPYDSFWHTNHIAMACNRGKRSLSLNLKDERGMEALLRLARDSDVVHHNMRDAAAQRLGVDFESLRAINPDLIYCHTRGFERGHRDGLPGNDQTAAALAGVTWADGGCDDGGRPLWSLTSLGDFGNGFLSAIGVLQALYHRDRTGEGCFVDTSIVYACLLNTSYTWMTEAGEPGPRPHLDGDELGMSATYRLYPTADGWLCLAALTEDHWRSCAATLGLGDLITDPRFATVGARRDHDGDLRSRFVGAFVTCSAADWFAALDAAGVPCEISSDTVALGVFDDPELIERGWVVRYEQGIVGRLDQAGCLVDLSDTPGRIAGPPLVVGDSSREVLREVGYGDDAIDALVAAGVVIESEAATGRAS
ncbi:MAG: CoA transferase, partial [Acidimicrobiia bacterium]|nr:CoA transferase [Acidimicrobiia bacterium]